MSHKLHLNSWQAELASRFVHFSKPAIKVLALYSFGVILTTAFGLSAIALFLSKHLGKSYDSVRKRLREFYLDKDSKSGAAQGIKRAEFDVTTAFAPLLEWILSLWEGRHLPLVIDVTNLGERFHVLCVSVVVRGTAIPVAWKVLAGGKAEAWNPHWKVLLTSLKAAIPNDYFVIVLSDRGLESTFLFKSIVELGFHPVMRIKKCGKFKPTGWSKFYPLSKLVSKKGVKIACEGHVYETKPLRATLLGRWDEEHEDSWLILTDLAPKSAQALWYGLRTWIEQGFKVLKGGGWGWDKTRMEDPDRVERVWLVLAVATLWVTALGVDDEVRSEQEEERRRAERDLKNAAERVCDATHVVQRRDAVKKKGRPQMGPANTESIHYILPL